MALTVDPRWPGLPVPAVMTVPRRYMIEHLLLSTTHLTNAVARLWARASNEAVLPTVTRILKHVSLTHRSDLKILANMPKIAQQELPLLQVMGLVFPGYGVFDFSNDYVLYPSESQGLVGTTRHHPFGVLVLQGVVHLFVDTKHLRGALRGINEFLLRYSEEHKSFRLFVHFLHRAIEPKYHSGIQSSWPMIVYPSVLVYWRVPSDPGGYPKFAKFITPFAEQIDLKTDKPIRKIVKLSIAPNWAAWMDMARELASTMDSLCYRASFVSRLTEVPEVTARARVPLPTASYLPYSKAQYASLTGLLPWGERKLAKPRPQPRLGDPHDPEEFRIGRISDASEEYAGPAQSKSTPAHSQIVAPTIPFQAYLASDVAGGNSEDTVQAAAEALAAKVVGAVDPDSAAPDPQVVEALQDQALGLRTKGRSTP